MGPRHVNMRGRVSVKPLALYDKWLLIAAICIIGLGLLMVASTSIVISEKQYHQPFHYLIRQTSYLGIGIVLSLMIMRFDIKYWQNSRTVLLLAAIFLLAIILIPGIGRSVNGSIRWIGAGPFGLQVSEFAKLAVIIYLSGYLVTHEYEVRNSILGFLKPMLILAIIGGLLLKEPDFGATVVIFATALGMMFVAGVRIGPFIALVCVVAAGIALLAVASPYRMQRLTTFLNPWDKQFDSGYQLTQSLIAFGRGGWLGVGLGDSVQKLFYLPEAHTDFLFAVLAEELGLIGILVIFLLYSLLVVRGLLIARRAQLADKFFAGYVAYGLSLWLGMQAAINIGVNSGLLPTKGLTLPLMSYGGSSMLINCIVIALLMRIDHETRWDMLGLSQANTNVKLKTTRAYGI